MTEIWRNDGESEAEQVLSARALFSPRNEPSVWYWKTSPSAAPYSCPCSSGWLTLIKMSWAGLSMPALSSMGRLPWFDISSVMVPENQVNLGRCNMNPKAKPSVAASAFDQASQIIRQAD